MSDQTDPQQMQGRLLGDLIQRNLQIIDFERELLRRDYMRQLHKLVKRRRVQLRCLAELDQIAADVQQTLNLKKRITETNGGEDGLRSN